MKLSIIKSQFSIRNSQLFRILLAAFTLLLLPLFTSCEVEFSPNAEWKDVPAVYGILDQDSTINYVRVQKCFLSEDDFHQYTTVMDSVNYPLGSIEVYVNVWQDRASMQRGGTPYRVLDFEDTLIVKDEGEFVSEGGQHVFKHNTRSGDFNPDYYYELVVTNLATGKCIARAVTQLVGASPNAWLESPNPYRAGNAFSFSHNRRCTFTWKPFERGRFYQPVVTFFYRHRFEDQSVLYPVDIRCQQTRNLTVDLQQGTFLNAVKDALVNDTCKKNFYDTVRVTLNVCNEELYAYMASASSLAQNQQLYSNIEGGVGVFGARRTKVCVWVPADKSDVGPSGLHFMLRELNVGF